MNDYGQPLEFGLSLQGWADDPRAVVDRALLAEDTGLDLVLLGPADECGRAEPWTVLSWIAGRTQRLRLVAGEMPLIDQNAAVLSRAAASLDLLTGGRVELGLAMSPADEAGTIEALTIVRGLWDTGEVGQLRVDGSRHRATDLERGPAPAHRIPVHLAGEDARGLDLIGRYGDAWNIPSALTDAGLLVEANRRIDAAAIAAGRDPREIRRVLTLTALPVLTGDTETDPALDELVRLVVDAGTATVLLAADDPEEIDAYGRLVAPTLRAAVARRRAELGIEEGVVVPAEVRRRRRAGIDYGSIPAALLADAVEPGDVGYASVRSNYIRGGSPGLVLRPRTRIEVAEAVTWARTQDVPLGVRSGGHGFSGRSTNNGGIVIDVGHLRAIDVLDEESRLVRIEPGARWGEVAAALRPHGWALSSGDSGGVGVGGLATAGGIGFLSREHGLTIDRVRAVEVVLADGGLLRATAMEHPDLFWGMRGAGFNFGVAVAFEFEVEEVGPLGVGRFVFDVSGDLAGFLERWGAAVEASPREVTSFLTMGAARDGGFIAQTMNVVDSADPSRILDRLQPLARVAPLAGRQVLIMDYDALVTAGPRIGHQGAGEPSGRSGLLTHVSPAFARDAERLLRSGATYFFQIRALGGATADIGPEETAFAHRDAQFSVLAMGSGSRLDPLWEPMRSHFTGLYLSFETGRGPERLAEAFPPATLARLRDLKRRYDPQNVFTDNFNIAPTD